jgi:hypothetical protein
LGLLLDKIDIKMEKKLYHLIFIEF